MVRAFCKRVQYFYWNDKTIDWSITSGTKIPKSFFLFWSLTMSIGCWSFGSNAVFVITNNIFFKVLNKKMFKKCILLHSCFFFCRSCTYVSVYFILQKKKYIFTSWKKNHIYSILSKNKKLVQTMKMCHGFSFSRNKDVPCYMVTLFRESLSHMNPHSYFDLFIGFLPIKRLK